MSADTSDTFELSLTWVVPAGTEGAYQGEPRDGQQWYKTIKQPCTYYTLLNEVLRPRRKEWSHSTWESLPIAKNIFRTDTVSNDTISRRMQLAAKAFIQKAGFKHPAESTTVSINNLPPLRFAISPTANYAVGFVSGKAFFLRYEESSASYKIVDDPDQLEVEDGSGNLVWHVGNDADTHIYIPYDSGIWPIPVFAPTLFKPLAGLQALLDKSDGIELKGLRGDKTNGPVRAIGTILTTRLEGIEGDLSHAIESTFRRQFDGKKAD